MRDRWMKVSNTIMDQLTNATTEQQKEALRRKLRKEWYKRDHPIEREDFPEGVLKRSIICPDREYSESWIVFYILDRNKVRLAEVAPLMNKYMCLDGHRINSIYDCTGQQFSHRANVRIFKDRIAVWQWQGLDV